MEAAKLGPQRHHVMVQKYEGDDVSGTPFETVTATVWVEGEGVVITDPQRIEGLERALQASTEE